MRTVSYMEMSYGELEELVKETYKVEEYEFVAQQECGNDSSHTFEVKAEPWDVNNILGKYALDKFEEWIQSKGHKGEYMNYIIMQALVNDGVLSAGHYLIQVCW